MQNLHTPILLTGKQTKVISMLSKNRKFKHGNAKIRELHCVVDFRSSRNEVDKFA